MLATLEETFEGIATHAENKNVKLPIIEQTHIARRDAIKDATSLTALDAMKTRLDNVERKLYDDIDREHERITRPPKPPVAPAVPPQPAHTPVSVTPPAVQPAPPTPAQPKVKTVSRSRIFKPLRLHSTAEIDDYIARARAELIAALKDNDAIKLD